MEPQAVVGFAFKVPQGIADEDAFWDVLVSGRNLSTKWPASRANIEAFYEEEKNVPNKVFDDLSNMTIQAETVVATYHVWAFRRRRHYFLRCSLLLNNVPRSGCYGPTTTVDIGNNFPRLRKW